MLFVFSIGWSTELIGLESAGIYNQSLTNCVLHSYGVNRLMGTLKPQSNGPLYSNTVIGTLAVDGWAATFDTARRGVVELWHCPVPSSLYQM